MGGAGCLAALIAILLRALGAPPAQAYSEGIRVVTFSGQRSLPRWKTTNYLTARAGLQQASAVGAGEALYVNEAGQVTFEAFLQVFAAATRHTFNRRSRLFARSTPI